MKALLQPCVLGDIEIDNRVIMAPMTRSRAGAGDAPTDLAVAYYRQRASAGLIITEGTQPSAEGKGYCRTPGIYTDRQRQGWKAVSDAVHAAGGRIVMQVMHCGRVASHYNKDPDAETVAPSAIRAAGEIYTDAVGMAPHDEPRALETAEIPRVVDDYRAAGETAFAAGMDGLELHCTSGYLPAQFLATGTNRRSDAYGGSPHRRIRFVVEALEALVALRGAGRVGLRICPGNPFNDLQDDEPEATFAALLDAISPMGLAYLHVIRRPQGPVDNIALARRHFSGPLIVNDSYDGSEADAALDERIQAVSFGRDFVANPDLVERLRDGLPLARFNPKTLYTPGAQGYTDYPRANG
jgi:N-ethylmaleimide reductase